MTHCKHGHPYDDANTYRRPDFGWRNCRKCNAFAHLKRWRERRDRVVESTTP